MQIIPNYQLFTDGACSGNPGPGGFGYLWLTPDHLAFEGGGFVSHTTNNAMELMAILEGIRARPSEMKSVVLYSDSKYALDGLTKYIHNWVSNGFMSAAGEPIKNQSLWQDLYQEVVQQRDYKISYHWIKGHAGIPLQERVDEIARTYSQSDGASPNLELKSGQPVEVSTSVEAPSSSHSDSARAYYLVKKGDLILRYATWDECKSAVHGVPGVKFKKVHSLAEEQACLKAWHS